MSKHLFFKEAFIQNLVKNKSIKPYQNTDDKVFIQGETYIHLIPAILFESTSHRFSISFKEAIKRQINIQKDKVLYHNIDYKLSRGFIGRKQPLIHLFKTEHQNIRQLIKAFYKHMNQVTPFYHKLNQELTYLFECLNEHIEKEDKYFYQMYLKKLKNQEMLLLYEMSMQQLKQLAKTYYQKWKANIKEENILSFKLETASIMEMINQRIENEEEILFPYLLKAPQI